MGGDELGQRPAWITFRGRFAADWRPNGAGVKGVGQHHIEGPRITVNHPQQQTFGRGDFIFADPLWFVIQRDPQRFAVGRRARHQQQRHLPVIILNPVSGWKMDRTQ